MRAILILTLFLSLHVFSQDTINVKLQPVENESPIMINKYNVNYNNGMFYNSLDQYKITIPLDFKIRRKYFFYNEKGKTYKIYY